MLKYIIKKVIISAVLFLGVALPSKSLVPIPKNAKKVQFAGRTWAVIETFGGTVLPGPNYFKNENVWVDKEGYLHLKIYKDENNGRIYCAEIYSQETFLYGTFEIEIDKIDYNKFPLDAVLGIFTYRGDGEEIDLEFTYKFWTNNFANYSVQPIPPVFKFTPDLSESSKHLISWNKNTVEFKSICNKKVYRSKMDAFELSSCSDKPVSPYKIISQKPARFHMNLWYHREIAPPVRSIPKKYRNAKKLTEFEVVIKDFKYRPLKTLTASAKLAKK